MSQEVGALDNRLILDPSDDRWATSVGSWTDGEEYTFSEVKVRQISPGKFEVISATAAPAEAEEAEAPAEGEQESNESMNPAVRKMMMKR